MTGRPHRLRLALILSALAIGSTLARAQQMPDARQMSGIPRPDAQLKSGTLTVRVVRGSFANPVDSLTVEIVGGPAARRATTNAEGRAEFTGVAPGTRIKAVAMVAGEKLESQEFVMPADSGIRLALVAADPSSGAAAAPPGVPVPQQPAQPGTVVLGEDSRFVFEMGEDGLTVFYILQIQNASASPVQTGTPVLFDLPADARGATVIEGSSPQATVNGRRLQIAGPFQPGNTLVQAAYTMPFHGPELAVEQRLPITLMHLAVVAQKIGDMRLSSPQMTAQQTMPANGNLYIAGRGGAVQAGEVVRFSFSGMPHHATWPRDLAIALAFLLLAGGAWSSLRVGGGRTALDVRRRNLESRRDRLFDELAVLEASRRELGIDPERYAERRRELVTALEEIYAALDEELAVDRAS